MKLSFGLALVAGILLTITTAIAQERDLEGDGIWMGRHWTEESGSCTRDWVCAHPGAVGLDEGETLTSTAPAQTTGTCTDDGAGNSCRSCSAPEPTTACTWQIETTE